jgi:hypothetical protein
MPPAQAVQPPTEEVLPPPAPEEALAPPVDRGDVTRLDPLSRAGLYLAWAVLGAMAVGILVLLGAVLHDVLRPSGLEALREQTAAAVAARAQLPEAGRLDALIRDLEAAERGGGWRPADAQAHTRTMAHLLAVPVLDARRLGALQPCLAAAASVVPDAARQTRLTACLLVLQGLRRDLQALPDGEALRLAIDFQRLDLESRQALRANLLQITQMILLNLLLPVLTALLGYLFATRSLGRGD